jgi:hypothetical protein
MNPYDAADIAFLTFFLSWPTLGIPPDLSAA